MRGSGAYSCCGSKTYGRAGISTVSRLSGAAPYTIRQGLKEIDSGEPIERKEKMRLQGAGRKKTPGQLSQISKCIYRKSWTAVPMETPKSTVLYDPQPAEDPGYPCRKISYRHQLPLCQQHSGKTGVQQTGKPENAPGWRTPS